MELNSTLIKNAADADEALYHADIENQFNYTTEYGEFMYQAGSWSHPRRVVFKIEKPYDQIIHMFTFVVTTMEDLELYQVLQFYCGRGKLENLERKSGLDFASVSTRSMVVNVNHLQVHALAYNLFNWFRRFSLPINMKKQCIDTIRLKLLKVAAKVVHSTRYTVFKLCSSCPTRKNSMKLCQIYEECSLSWNKQ